MKQLFVFTLLLSVVSPSTAGPTRIEKPSFKEMAAELKEPELITQVYGQWKSLSAKRDLSSQMQKLLQENEALRQKFLQASRHSVPFTRGEIEDEKVLNRIIQLAQLSILFVRDQAQKPEGAVPLRDEMTAWFLFAADLPYEEASLIGLRFSSVIRSLFLDELENLQKMKGEALAKDDSWLKWAHDLRAPWPVDRVILSEGKRVLGPKKMKTVEEVATALQKNTYQTSATALATARGGRAPEFNFIKKIWREEDIEQMKTEVNRISAFQIRLAAQIYQRKFQIPPKKSEELVSQHLLDHLPIDYKTGRPMTLEAAALRQ